MRKNIDLPDDVVEILTINAVKNKTVFKHYAEKILKEASDKIKCDCKIEYYKNEYGEEVAVCSKCLRAYF